jgi:hypothetical protein
MQLLWQAKRQSYAIENKRRSAKQDLLWLTISGKTVPMWITAL